MLLRFTPEPGSAAAWRRIARVLLACLIAANAVLGAAPERRGDLYVLSVGVEGHYPDTATDVNGQDAVHVRQALVAGESLYRQVHSRALVGTGATREAVFDGLAWLAREVRKDDVAFVFIACHGDVEKEGYLMSLAKSADPKATLHGISGRELNAAVAKVKGQPIVLLDSCRSGALIATAGTGHPAAMIVSCEANGYSVGQSDWPDRPSGFFVIAFCEALGGLADADQDRIVTLKEVADYLPARAQAFFQGQRALVVRQPAAEAIPLARVSRALPPQQMLTAPRWLNPFGWPDVPGADGAEVHKFAEQCRLEGSAKDPNAALWPREAVAVTEGIDGVWFSRWSKRDAPTRWASGTAQVKSVGNRVYILYQQDDGVIHVVETVRVGSDRLVGRYINPGARHDTTPWVGRIIDQERIDGEWGEGRWDLRRRFDRKAAGASQSVRQDSRE